MAAIDAALASGKDVVDASIAAREAELAERGEFTYVLIPHEAHLSLIHI